MSIIIPTALAASALEITEASGQLAAGEVAAGRVWVRPEAFVPFSMIGMWAGVLAEPARFGGVPCAAAPVRVQGGRMTHCTLDADTLIGAVTFPAGATLELIPGQAPQPVFRASLPVPLAVGPRTYPAGEELVLHPDGTVWFRIRAAQDGPPPVSLPCRWGLADDRVLLHPDGTLAQGILREDADVDGKRLPANTVVYLSPAGRLERVDLHGDWLWLGQRYTSGNRILFSEQGAVADVGSRFVVREGEDTRHPRWRVEAGFYYGYPWRDILPPQ